ncbi:MAG: primosomal protein N' [Phycisphaerales bacterium]|nr:primosomal protein N' [Phycisphaerales bacterium]
MAGLFDEPTVAFAQVAVERGVDAFQDGLTYGIPERLSYIQPGHLVTVPLGRGNTPTSAWVLSVHNEPPTAPKQIKQIYECNNTSIQLPSDLLSLASWMSQYYVTPIGPTLATMLPGPVRQGTGTTTRELVDLPDELPEIESLSEKQQAIVRAIQSLPIEDRPIDKQTLTKLAQLKSQSSIQTMIKHGRLVTKRVTRIEAQWLKHTQSFSIPEHLTDEQQNAFDAIASTMDSGYSSHLLHGVTGSGKTEVYIRLIQRVIEQGGSALVLVPEISLTPQTAAKLISRFPNQKVAILHSTLTRAQRHQQWALISEGKADIILGVRSAVFAPIPEGKLKLVIVDEEHESSYKQDSAPRYNGRDIAIRRAWMAKCPIVLGSATPSMESWWNATVRNISTLHTMKHRAPGLVVPHIELINMSHEFTDDGGDFALFSERLVQAMKTALDANGQVLILLNRRGFAPWIVCKERACDWLMKCDHCDSAMVFHRKKPLQSSGFVRCHHCGKEQRIPKSCPDCESKVIVRGAGTQRAEELLRNMLDIEWTAIARLDSDSATSASTIQKTLEKFGDGEIRVLLGTQMIAKGLDFPNVKLVGVLNADASIDLPDFRASERTYQLVSQVCGRCGRGTGESIAIIQTRDPDLQPIKLASKGSYETFANAELAFRNGAGLPPASRMVRFVIRHQNEQTAKGKSEALFERLKSLGHSDIQLNAPIPCVIPRIADFYRFECTALAPTSMVLQAFLEEARNIMTIGRELAVDVDPIALL